MVHDRQKNMKKAVEKSIVLISVGVFKHRILLEFVFFTLDIIETKKFEFLNYVKRNVSLKSTPLEQKVHAPFFLDFVTIV